MRLLCVVDVGRHVPYPNLYPDQSPSEEWTMEERFRPLTFHGLILRSQLVNLLIRGVCYAENQSVSAIQTPPPVSLLSSSISFVLFLSHHLFSCLHFPPRFSAYYSHHSLRRSNHPCSPLMFMPYNYLKVHIKIQL